MPKPGWWTASHRRSGAVFTSPPWPRPFRAWWKTVWTVFYRGPLAEVLAQGMETLGLPVTLADLHAHVARRTTPLKLQHQQGEIYNHAPPTQGLVSLAILGITDRLNMAEADDAGTIHRIVEATKLAFGLRDAHITDPRELKTDIQALLAPTALQALADRVDDSRAAPWGTGKGPGDTVWMGVMDNSGLPCRLSRVFITNLAAAWYCPIPASSGRTGAHRSVSTPVIFWPSRRANSLSTP